MDIAFYIRIHILPAFIHDEFTEVIHFPDDHLSFIRIIADDLAYMAGRRIQSIVDDQSADARCMADRESSIFCVFAPLVGIAAEGPFLGGIVSIFEDIRTDDGSIPSAVTWVEAVLDLLGIGPFGDDTGLIFLCGCGRWSGLGRSGVLGAWLFDRRNMPALAWLIDSRFIGDGGLRDDLRYWSFQKSEIIGLFLGYIDEDFLAGIEDFCLILHIVESHQVLEIEVIFVGEHDDIGPLFHGIDETFVIIQDLQCLARLDLSFEIIIFLDGGNRSSERACYLEQRIS